METAVDIICHCQLFHFVII